MDKLASSVASTASCTVTVNGAKILGLEGYGLKPGCHADMVILQAIDIHEALRLKPARLFVIRRGKVIAETPPVVSRVELADKKVEVDFSFQGKY